jgi:FkbM family methyltransferase
MAAALIKQFDDSLHRPTPESHPVENLFGQLAQQYALTVVERDQLLAANQQMQNAQRGGVRKGAKAVHAARPVFPQVLLPTGVVTVVDVGGQNLVNEDHIYTPLTQTGRARVVAFEPLEDKAEERRQSEADLIMLNHFVGQGGPARFHVTQFDPTSSLLEPNLAFLRQFVSLAEMCTVTSTQEISTTRLDDIPEIGDCDFLKIDVQGGELDVLKGSARVLADTLCVHCEVEFAPVYIDQPLFADVDIHLRGSGFELMDMMNAGYTQYKALGRGASESRMMWAEAVYFRPAERLEAPQKLLTAAFIAHTNYGMYDLAAHYLSAYEARTGVSALPDYLQALAAAAPSVTEE